MTRGQVQAMREELWDAGFRPVGIYNIDAKHSAPGKASIGNDWIGQARLSPPAAVRNVVEIALNTGILCDGLRGFDLDIEDADLIGRIRALAIFMFGETLMRVRENSPRCLLVYQAAKGEPPKRWIAGTAGKVEVLGRGQQFVAFGLHPTGAELRWMPQPPNEVTRDSLPAVTEEQVGDFLRQVAPWIGAGEEKAESTIKREDNAHVRKLIAELRTAGAENMNVLADVGKDLLGRLELAVSERPALRARWEGALDDLASRGRDTSRSGLDLSLAALLKGAGFTPLDVALLLLAYPHGAAFDDAKHPEVGIRLRYVARTALRASVASTAAKAKPTDRAVIHIKAGELHHTATAGEDALIASGLAVFRRDKQMVRPVSHTVPASGGRMTVSAGLDTMTLPALIDVLSQAAVWQKWNERREAFVPCNPSKDVAAVILSRAPISRLPLLSGVITTPTLRPDGSLLLAPGYDPTTRLYHVHDTTLQMPPLPERPTRADADRAIDLLSDLLREFPFVDPVVDRAVALSAIITALIRSAFPAVPMHAFRATTAGTGKSFLADVVAVIATGRTCPVIALSDKEEETEKRLTGVALAGYPLVSLDNVNGELGGDLLCQLIERPLLRLRPLGGSGMVDVENRTMVLANGNALRVRGDMVRRSLVANLDAKVERPELREFDGDPVATVAADRGRYVAACLIIVRAYIAAGLPESPPRLASYEEWSGWVRGALIWLGCGDPAASIEMAREDDPVLSTLQEVLGVWKEAAGANRGITVRALVDISARRVPEGELEYPDLRNALMKVSEDRGRIDPGRLGLWLLSMEGRITEGLSLRRTGKDRNKVAIWSVIDATR